MSNSITDFLAAILSAKYGKQVRGAIHDAIELCYQDGKAGVNDLEARHLIEQVIGVNEMQDAGIETLTARVEALEQGDEGESAGTTTTTVPTFIVDSGIVNFSNVGANKSATEAVTFSKTFTEAPVVVCIKAFRNAANTFYSQVTAQPILSSITTTGCTLAVGNRYSQAVSPSVLWVAFQPTEIEINTEIIVPSGDGMTEAEVRELLAPISAALNGIKTGYDGTVYDTPGEAVREQINDLHVLIGDTPGTAIQASAVAYNDSNVAAELTNVNGRLQQKADVVYGGDTADTSVNLTAGYYWHQGANPAPVSKNTRAMSDGIAVSPDMVSLSVSDGYVLYVFGNDDGEDAVKTSVSKAWGTSLNLADVTYKYVYVNVRRSDDENIMSDDLSDILTLTAYTEIIPYATQEYVDEALTAVNGSGSGLTPEISTAILNCFQHVAWTSADGLAHYTALRVLLFPVTIIVNDNVMSIENADEITSVSKDGMTLILL